MLCAETWVRASRSAGEANQRMQRAVARQNRIDRATSLAPRELAGLLSRGDTYNASDFSASHKQFKHAHNLIFVHLALRLGPGSVFYLDGADGASTAALRQAGLSHEDLYVANVFADTCVALRDPPHGLSHVAHMRAEHALHHAADAHTQVGCFGRVPFCAVYLDGCGGSPLPLQRMVAALFHERRRHINPAALAIGLTLTDADPSGRSQADREQDVLSDAARACRAQGYAMTRLADEPERFGLDRGCLPRRSAEGGTLTTWIVCTRL